MTTNEHRGGSAGPAEEIAALIATNVPGADTVRLTGQLATVKLSPAKADAVLAHLRTHPDALTSGEATGPAVWRRVLDVLATEYPEVQRMRCHRCGAERRLPYRRDGAGICTRCYAQTHLKGHCQVGDRRGRSG